MSITVNGVTHKVVQDLVADDLNHLKGLSGSNRVDQNIAMDTDEVLGIQDRVLILRK